MSDEVFNEPIATGWLRTELAGNIGLAKGYVMDARKMLGNMRTMYGVNQRIADGEPGGFYRQSLQLPDGSLMEAITNDGMDTIRITTQSTQQQTVEDTNLVGQSSSSTVKPESHGVVLTHTDVPIEMPVLKHKTEELGERSEQEIVIEKVIIVGACEDLSGDFAIKHPTLWNMSGSASDSATAPEGELSDLASVEGMTVAGYAGSAIDLGFLPDCYSGEALDISGDGLTVVGYCLGAAGKLAFRWTQKEGMQDLGDVPNGRQRMMATSVSDDGSVICGLGLNSIVGTVAWRWTAATGCVQLPDIGIGVSGFTNPSVSPNGKYITGVINTPVIENANFAGVVWVDTGSGQSMVRIPLPGTTREEPDARDITLTIDHSLPSSVTDSGVVTGSSTHFETIGTYYSLNTYYSINPNLRKTVFTWDVHSGAYAISGNGFAIGIANDAGVIIGNSTKSFFIFIPSINGWIHVMGDATWASDDTWSPVPALDSAGFTPPVHSGWYKTSGKMQTMLGDGTQTHDITDDGSIIVGIAQFDVLSQPAMWDEADTLTLLPLLNGTTTGWATAVATPTISYTIPD